MKRKLWLAGAGATFTGAATARAGAQAALTPITIVMSPTVDATAFYYAMSKGMFEKEGLAITMKVVASGNLGIVAVVGGDAQVGFANCLSLSQAHQRGVPLQLIAGAGLYDTTAPIARIFVAADSPIRGANDLEDHVVAISGLHDLLALAVRAWLASQGADSTKIRFVELPPPAMLAALEAKRVDAISTFEPFSSDVAASGHARTLAYPYDAIAKQFNVTAWYAHGSWLASHRDAAVRYGRVIREAATYANAHLADMVPIVATASGMSLDVVGHALRAKVAPVVNPATLQPLIDVAAKFKELDAPFPARDMLYTP